MSRVIPNEESWIGVSLTAPADPAAPSAAEIADAINITSFVISLNPTSTGNAVPTPSLDSLFDRSVIGTSQGAFSGDFYRDDGEDLAWDLLPRGTHCWWFISRFGGTGDHHEPLDGEMLEVWETSITQRAASQLTSNTVQTFSVTAAVNEPPVEDAVVGGGSASGLGVPTGLTATPGAAGEVDLDWTAPASGTPTGYKVFMSTSSGGSYTELTTGIVVTGESAAITGLGAGTKWFKVSAFDAGGDGPRSAAVSAVIT